MKKVCWRFFCLAAWQCAALAGNESTCLSEPLPPANEVVQKIIARSKWSRAQNFQQFYSFTRSTVTEEFDGKGRIKSRQEKSWRVPAKKEASLVVANDSTAD